MNTLYTTSIALFTFAGSVLASDNDTLSMNSLLLNDAAEYRVLNENTDDLVDINGFVVARWQYNDESNPDSQFSLPYARVGFSGQVEDWGYNITGEWSDSTETFTILDAFITTQYAGFDFRIGQFVPEFFAGFSSSPLDNVTGEYSVIATTFGQGRSQGVEVSRSFGDFVVSGSYTDGFQTTTLNGPNSQYGLTGRLDWNVSEAIRVGGAYSHQESTTDFDSWTIDATVAFGEFDFDAAFITSDLNGSFGDNYGFVGTVSYDVTDTLQPFVQYEHGVVNNNGDLNLVSVGVNQYFNSNVRLTTSVGYSLDTVSGGWNTGRSGWNQTNNDEQILVNAQLSLSF